MQSKTVRIVVVIAVLALFAVAVAAAGCAPTTPTTTTTQPSTTPSTTPSTQPSSTTATPSTPPTALTGVALGKNIWDTGSDNNGPVKWTQGVSNMKNGACKQCHGLLGKGGPNGAPNITYPKIKSVFNATTFARAVTKGLDEAGKPLGKKMPRFGTLKLDDVTGLWDFIKTLK